VAAGALDDKTGGNQYNGNGNAEDGKGFPPAKGRGGEHGVQHGAKEQCAESKAHQQTTGRETALIGKPCIHRGDDHIVCDADAQKVREATSKANLIHLAEQEESLALTFCKERNGVATSYSLQTIKTRESDHHHVVIGVRRESEDHQEAGSVL
jgi:hypothetical protein